MNLAAETVARFCKEILLRLDTSEDDAVLVAEHLVDADLCGVRSHGLIRLNKYVDQIDSGYIANTAAVICTKVHTNLLRVDANMNFGILGFHRLIPSLKDLARQYGIAGGALVNCAHTGRIGAYTEILAREHMWSMAFGGGGRAKLKEVAPFGGRMGVFDTNPYSFSMPLDKNMSQIATSDFATSATAQGKLLVYRTNENPVPAGWLLDKSGVATTRAEDFYEGGVLLPAGGAKGYGMGFIAELFGDAALGKPHELNWFMIAVDLNRFAGTDSYFSAANHLRSEIERCPPAEGVDRVRWPGQPELESRERQSVLGIEYSPAELNSLAALESRFSIKLTE